MIRDTHSMDSVVERQPWWRRRPFWWVAGGLLISAWWLVPAFGRWTQAERSVDGARLRTGVVVRGDLERDVAVQGRIVAAFHPKLYSPEQGIVSLKVRPGAVVTEGTVLATIGSPELSAEIERQASQVASQEGQLSRQKIAIRQQQLADAQGIELSRVRRQAAERELKRSRQLFEQGLLNRGDFEKAEDELRIADLEQKHAEDAAQLSVETRQLELRERQLEVERQRVTLEELEQRRHRLSILAPFDGMVATLDVQDRDAVVPNQPLLTVVDLTSFEIEIRIPEAYADEVTAGVEATVLYDGEPYLATVTSMSPEVDASQVAGRVAFVGEAPRGLKQNQRLSTRLILERRTQVLKLPRGPYFESGGGRKIYVLADGIATLQDIQVGATSVAEVEILEGLAEGEHVLLTDINRFRGAERVIVRD